MQFKRSDGTEVSEQRKKENEETRYRFELIALAAERAIERQEAKRLAGKEKKSKSLLDWA
jgi:hypothetical protein